MIRHSLGNAGSARREYEMRLHWNSARTSRVTFRVINLTEEWNMKERLLITTAIGLMLGTGAFAQSPSDKSKTNPPPTAPIEPGFATFDGSVAGSIYPAAELAPSGTDQYGAADQQSDPSVAYRLQHEYQCGDSTVHQHCGSTLEHPIQHCAVRFVQCQRLGRSQ
jgi:hypothetical protein